ncbi:Uncharacterised protein [Mycobacteroides abscessus subsp. abscessus]|nr:Uncharacterised protein [Mycobacteroides abscessus subsp. abscessus]
MDPCGGDREDLAQIPLPVGVPVQDRTIPSTETRSRPGGARPGSVAVGRVMSRDGSLMVRPSVMSSSKVRRQAAPNPIVW